MNKIPDALRHRIVRLLAAPLFLCCLLALAATEARADEVTIAGSTSGHFNDALGNNTGTSLMGLRFISSTFNVTTSGGQASLDGSPANPNVAGSANFNNLGSFYIDPPAMDTLDNYAGSTFTLTVTFTAPGGISGGPSGTFTATLTGHVIRIPSLQSYSVNVNFDNTPQQFNFTQADGSTGTFSLTVFDITGITPNFPRAIKGEITLASQDAAAVPEPATLVLLGTGLAGAVGAARRRRADGGRADG